MLVAGILLLLYFWVFVADVESVSTSLIVSDAAAIAAAVSLIVALVSYFWAPRAKLVWSAFASYALLVLTTVLLLSSTGYLFSPFIALWMLVALFGPIFGWYGILFTLLVMASFLGWLVSGDGLTVDQLTTSLFITITPLIVGVLAWQASRDQVNTEDRTVSELARELRTVAGKSEVVIAAIADGVLALDKNGTIELINPAAQRIIGWGKNDAIGLDYKSVLKLHDSHDKPIEPNNDPIQKALETNKEVSVDTFSIETAESGRKLLAHITVSPIGSLGSGAIVVFRDITNQRSEEREQAEFISTASHEMRTPVASIEGYLGLALNPSTASVDERARDFITKAHEAAQHLGRLFQDLLDVSRADDNRLSNKPQVIDLVPFVQDIVVGLTPKAEEKGLQVSYKPAPSTINDDNRADKGEKTLQPVFYVNVDADHLREVVSNLVENAIKYTVEGSVTIDIAGDDTHATLSIADSGIGIPHEDLSHLFQKFYRVDNTETREIGGTGLGLYLSRKLTEAMEGKIWAESEYQRGSTFFVQLPRLDHVEAKRLIEQSERQAKQAPPTISHLKVEQTMPTTNATPITAAPVTPQQPAPIHSQASVPVSTPPAPVTSHRPIPVTSPAQPQPQQQPQVEQPQPQSQQQPQQPHTPPRPQIQPQLQQQQLLPTQPATPAPSQPSSPMIHPAPAAPAPVPPGPPQPAPTASQLGRPAPVFMHSQARVNTPISSIEENPRQYIQDQAANSQNQPRQP